MTKRILALAGGVGGAKLALGLAGVLPAEALTVAVNTADDFEHLGLMVCPDLDTVMYTLADVANPETGWGRRDESWTVMEALGPLGGETWFRLGDKDLATHIERTRRLRAGETLSSVTRDLSTRLGVKPAMVPMSDDPVRTMVTTDRGELAFQDWFVRLRCEPKVKSVRFAGAETALANPALLDLADLRAIVVCPSNPFVSVAPILAGALDREAVVQTAVEQHSALVHLGTSEHDASLFTEWQVYRMFDARRGAWATFQYLVRERLLAEGAQVGADGAVA